MRILYKWLKRFVDFDLNPRDLALTLSSIGIETVVIPPNNHCWTNVVSAKVLTVQKHPYADKLYLCEVSDALNNYLVVCGAKNIAVGQVVPLARIGAVLANNIRIKESKIRGIKSEGMICSKTDLGIAEGYEDVLVFDENSKIGIAIENILEKPDSVLEIEITPNRGDCLSYLGIAREIGAMLRKKVLFPSIKISGCEDLKWIEVRSDLCHRYVGCVMSGVRVGLSPKWISDVLEKSGIRSINNIVDIINYVMIELGQPLHAFDVNKLSSNRVIIRMADNCEKIMALNDIEYKLDSDMLVISDCEKPIAIAGIMGGKYTCIDEKTETIFLESAIFDNVTVRKTSRKLNLSTDSSYRFERGLCYDMSCVALWRVVNLITEIAGGKLELKKDLKIVKYSSTDVILRTEKISKILGYNVGKDEIFSILKFLGIDVKCDNEKILCNIPSWRNDIKEEVDLIEEIARIKGYDFIPFHKISCDKMYEKNNSFFPLIVKEFRTKLNFFGFSEALNYSFLEIKELDKFGLKYFYKVLNPISKENEVLRPSLLPALYKNLLLNIEQDCETISLFEYGKVFNELGERKNFALIMYGKIWGEWWKWVEQKINPKYDFYFGGGIIKNILPSDKFTINENLYPKSYYHPGKNAAILYTGKLIGQFGVLTPSITSFLKDDVVYCEIDLGLLECVEKKSIYYKPYSKFPIVKRDISIVTNKSLQFHKIENIIKDFVELGGILRKYLLFSVYSDEIKLGKEKIVYSFRLFYKNDKKTLTDGEVNKDLNVLLKKLNDNFDIKLR